MEGKKRMKENEDSLRDLWNNIKYTNVCIIGAIMGFQKKRERPGEMVHPYGEQYENSFKKLELPYDPTILLLGIYPARKDKNSNSKRYMHPSVHSSTVYNSQGMGAT